MTSCNLLQLHGLLGFCFVFLEWGENSHALKEPERL